MCQALHTSSFEKCVPDLSNKFERPLAQVLEGIFGEEEVGVAEGLSSRNSISLPDILGSPKPASSRLSRPHGSLRCSEDNTKADAEWIWPCLKVYDSPG